MGPIKRCLICLNYLKSKKKDIPPNTLEEQTVISYFLRKLAWTQLSKSEYESYLKFGNPSQWAALCYICERDVKKCWDIQKHVLKLLNEIAKVRKKLYVENYYETDDEDEEDKGDRSSSLYENNVQGIFKKLREKLFTQVADGEEDNVTNWNVEQSISVTYENVKPKDSSSRDQIVVKEEAEEDFEQDDEAEGTYDNDNDMDLDEEDPEEGVVNDLINTAGSVKVGPSSSNGEVKVCVIAASTDKRLPFESSLKDCPECGKTYSHPSIMRRHYRETHLDSKGYSCSLCFKKFSRKEYAIRHIHADHADQVSSVVKERYPCDKCPASFTLEGALKLHKRKIHPVDLQKCNLCEKSYKSKSSLDDHKLRAHKIRKGASAASDSEDNQTRCEGCNKNFSSKYIYRRHVREVHTRVRNYPCPKCSNTFIRRSDRERHVYTVHQCKKTNKECPDCRKPFLNVRAMERHMRIVHDRKIEVSCDICGRTYASAESLGVHMKAHRNTNTSGEVEDVDTSRYNIVDDEEEESFITDELSNNSNSNNVEDEGLTEKTKPGEIEVQEQMEPHFLTVANSEDTPQAQEPSTSSHCLGLVVPH